MTMIGIKLNGKEVFVEQGSNLLEAALTSGVDVPHLCYDPRLKPFGSCRLCFVEVAGRPAAVPACGTAVTAGMEVTTDSNRLADLRRVALELLLAEHCGDCVAPCQSACPASIDIQGFIAHMANGQHKKAAALIKEKMPLPSVCGRICPRFCEDECRRNLVDEAVNICALKRFAGDYDLQAINAYEAKPGPDTGLTVAVVGGGPAGLSAAYYLALAGHRVTLYDAGPKLGGMLRYGIPEYRLPKELLDQEINLITSMCYEVRLGEVLGKDYSIEELKDQFDAVFLGLGCQQAQGMGLADEDMPGILKGIDFLRMVVEGHPPELGNRVAVIGGGNTAMDAARTALRLGVEDVVVIYRRSRDEMPANPVEIIEAEEEGVQFHFLTNPTACIQHDGRLGGLECIRMELGEADSSGRRRPVAVAGSEMELNFDTVILAIGQVVEKEDARHSGVSLSRWGTIDAMAETGCTDVVGVFAAGDCVSGAATVVEAVGNARKAARGIDLYLRGKEIVPEVKQYNCSMGELKDLDAADFADREKLERTPEIHLAPMERMQHFEEFNLGLSKDVIGQETKRCLSCGCEDVFNCTLRKLATEYKVDTKRLGVNKKRYDIVSNHRYISHDANKCVLCGNCVRICQEVQDIGALGFANRGFDTKVMPSMGLPLAETMCESCGQCVSACPTGAITVVSPLAKPGPFEDDRVVASSCVQCSIGCDLELHVVGDTITKVTSPLRSEVNDGNLCKKGSFEYGFVHSKGRLRAPLLRTGETMKTVEWDEAMHSAAAMLEKIRDRYGPDSLAVLVSPNLTNEANYLAQKLARIALRTNNIESTNPVPAGTYAGAASLQTEPITYRQVVSSDFILVINNDPTIDYPIVAQKIRRAADAGATVGIISPRSTRLDGQAKITIRTHPRKTLKLLQAIQAYLQRYDLAKEGLDLPLTDEEIKHLLLELPETVRVKPSKVIELLHLYLQAKNPVIIVDGTTVSGPEQSALLEIVRATGNARAGQGIMQLFKSGNSRGQLDMGVHPALLPGRLPLHDLEARESYYQVSGHPLPPTMGLTLPEIRVAAKEGDIIGVILIGDDFNLDDEMFDEGLFTVAITSTWRTDLNRADVVLPAPTFAESAGTVTNSEGRLQRLNPAFAAPGGKDLPQIIAGLAQALGVPLGRELPEQIMAEMQEVSGWCLGKAGKFFICGEKGNKVKVPVI